MTSLRRPNNAVQMFITELGARVVASSGVPTDMFHLGKLILQGFKDAPNCIMQIDGATGASETNATVLEKSVRCAISMKNYGVQCDDAIVIMAPNHLDLAAPLYAALYLGVAMAAVDRTLGVGELRSTFDTSKPKIIFCQREKASDVQQALNDLNLDSLVVTFNKGDSFTTLAEFNERYGGTAADVEGFTPSNFNAEENIGFLVPTSGTTDCSKFAALTHKNVLIGFPYALERFTQYPTPTKLALIVSPLQWLSAIIHFVLSPILRYTQLQSSADFNIEHMNYLVNTYKPTYMVLNPTAMTTLINKTNRDLVDISCFELIMLGGSAVAKELVEEARKLSPGTDILDGYGMTELCGLSFHADYTRPGSCVKAVGTVQCRIVNVDTQQDIREPNVTGELWLKGAAVFKEYYNNAEMTAEAFAEDKWFKTGDLFYRDEDWNYFFVERMKLLLKYKNNQVSPVEIENIIRQHPGVLEVAVTGIPEPECGELPVACVILQNGAKVTADEIKEMVKESLSDTKHLRGGVVFLKELPMTPSSKINRKKLKELVLNWERL